MDRNETAPGAGEKVRKPVDEVANRRIKKLDLDLLPYRLSLTYEEVGILLNRGKVHIEKLVASGALLTIERGRVSRRQWRPTLSAWTLRHWPSTSRRQLCGRREGRVVGKVLVSFGLQRRHPHTHTCRERSCLTIRTATSGNIQRTSN